MAKKIALAGILGGIALFVWESVAHMALPLGEAGLKGVDNEEVVAQELKANIREPGFYFFPAPDHTPGMSPEQHREADRKTQERWNAGPSGILIFHPAGMGDHFVRQMCTQFGADVLAMLLSAILLSWATGLGGYGGRALFVTLIGLIPTLAVEIPLWNWYGLPTVYTLAQFTVHLVGFAAGGLAVAALVRPGAGRG